MTKATMKGDGAPSVPEPTYTCQHCGAASPKVEWGPGHVTCPQCGKVALSAAEAAALSAAKVEAVGG